MKTGLPLGQSNSRPPARVGKSFSTGGAASAIRSADERALDQRNTVVLRGLALLFSVPVLFTGLNAVKLGLGPLPVRAMVSALFLPLALLLAPHRVAAAVGRVKVQIFTILYVGLLGLLVSLANANEMAAVLTQLTEIHVQALIAVIFSAILVEVGAPRALLLPFLIAFALSGATAVAQLAGVDHAWQLRQMIGAFTGDTVAVARAIATHSRGMGLALTPPLLGTHACLAFAVFFAHRAYVRGDRFFQRFDAQLLAFGLFCMVVCIAGGNRSPIIGFAALLLVYIGVVAPRKLLFVAPLIVVAPMILEVVLQMGSAAGLRVAETDDASAEGRGTLFYYASLLFLHQPFGYGLTFDSTKLASNYSQAVQYMGNPTIIQRYAPHNYFLLMLNKYGVMLLLALPVVAPRRKMAWIITVGFIPYVLHILFHNEGPLQSDFLFWFMFPFILNCTRECRINVDSRVFARTVKVLRAHADEGP